MICEKKYFYICNKIKCSKHFRDLGFPKCAGGRPALSSEVGNPFCSSQSLFNQLYNSEERKKV